jgi:predicted AlkP superfamily phosphohydrolase/phosphomutase/Flp pilus assembly protein TadD
VAQDSQNCVKRLLLVGWEAADWKVVKPLLAAGDLPNLASLIAAGVHGNQAAIYPALSPILWTSIATGKRPGKHGIHGFIEPAEDGRNVRPASSLGRRTKAFWNILNQHGRRSIVVGWLPSHPAEPLAGAMVSNRFLLQTGDDPQMPLPRGAVWPPEQAEALARKRVRATEISSDTLRLFAPSWYRINQSDDGSVCDLAAIIAGTMSIHAAATSLMESMEWDLAAVCYAGIDQFSDHFLRADAAKAMAVRRAGSAGLADIVANAYRYHDVLLGRLISLAGPESAVMVISDRGIRSDAPPDEIPTHLSDPATEHRTFGIFCLKAAGVRRGEPIYGASVLDVAPTVLHLFGLPAALDMDGRVLINAFENQRRPEPVASWDEIPGDDGRHPASQTYGGAPAPESLMLPLGYLAPSEGDPGRTVAEAVAECRYNLARSHMDDGRPDLATGILRALLEENPQEARFHQHLFYSYMQSGDTAGARRVLDRFDRICDASAPEAMAELKRRRAGRADEGSPLGTPGHRELYERGVLEARASGNVPDRLLMRIRLVLARAHTAERQKEALSLLEELARKSGRDPTFFQPLAECFGAAGDTKRALKYTHDLLRRNPEDPQTLALEARLHQSAGRHKEAVARAIESLSLLYFQPRLHCLLGMSLWRLGEEAGAEQAFRIALMLAPGLPAAHEGLGRLLRCDPARLAEASLHMAKAGGTRGRRKKTQIAAAEEAAAEGLPGLGLREVSAPADRSRVVIVVSGLPRSGTSMMMQMLAAGGIELFADGKRAVDEDNARGYFEHEKVTQLNRDTGWIAEARGKAVKVVAQFLPHLPSGEEFRIVFMHRAMEEVTASQSAILRRLGRKEGALDERYLARVCSAQLVRVREWLKRHPWVRVLPVRYAQVLEDPNGTARRLAAFLGAPFDESAAAECVVPAMRRQKGSV